MGIRRALSKIGTRYDREPKGCSWKGVAVPRERVPASLRALYDHFGGHRDVIKSRVARLFLPAELVVAADGVAFADNGSKNYTYLYRRDPGARKLAVYRTNDVGRGPRLRECDLDTFLVHFLGWMLCNTIWEGVAHVRLGRRCAKQLSSTTEMTAKTLVGRQSDYPYEVVFHDDYILFALLERQEGFVGYWKLGLSDAAEQYSIIDVI